MGLEYVAAVLVFDSFPLFVISLTLLGRGQLNTTGLVTFSVGAFAALLGTINILTGALGTLSTFSGVLIYVFGFTYLMAGFVFIKNYDLKALGSLLLFLGIVVAMYSGWFALNGFPIFSVLCAAYVVLFIFFWLFTWERMKAKPVAYLTLVEAFAAFLVPGFYLLAGGVFA